MQQETLNYYNENAIAFAESTQQVDFSDIQNHFLTYLPSDAYILDFGCGAGRDTKYFLEKGYQVEAVDGSEELCKLASDYTGIKVKHIYFEELHQKSVYDGVWACASILHLPIANLRTVLIQIAAALKENGILYTSFKYGTFSGMRNGRYFQNMTVETLEKLVEEQNIFHIEELWLTGDVRAGREEEKWLNIIVRKKKQSGWWKGEDDFATKYRTSLSSIRYF